MEKCSFLRFQKYNKLTNSQFAVSFQLHAIAAE